MYEQFKLIADILVITLHIAEFAKKVKARHPKKDDGLNN